MLIFTNDDYRRIQAWLKKNAIKDSDFAISQKTVPEEDILVITLNTATVPTNYKIKIKDLLNSSLGKIVIDSIIAKSVKVNNILTVNAANVKLDNKKGTTLQDVLNYFEENKLNRHTDDTFDGNLTVKKNITIEGNIKSHDGTITVEADLEATGEITDGQGNMLSDVNSVAKGWKIEYQDPQQDEPTVRAKYVLKDYRGVPKGNVIKVYKDSAITNVYLGTVEDICNPNTGEVTKHSIHDNNEALSIVYRLDTGKYSLVNVPIKMFTTEAEFDKYRGLGVTSNGQVFIKLASDVESSNYLHFNELGEITADGIETRILRDLGDIITSVAGDDTMWGVYKEHEGTQETSTPNDGSRWGEFKKQEAIREEVSNSAHQVFADNWDAQDDDPEEYDPLAVTEASYAYNWKSTDTPASDGSIEGNLKDLYQKTLNQGSKLSKLEQEQIQGGIYDVSAHNNGAVFESLQSLLSSPNLNTLIPESIRCGGMSIRFIQGSEQSSYNKYVQYRYMKTVITSSAFTNVDNWQGVDDIPTAGSDNLVKSGGVYNSVNQLFKNMFFYAGTISKTGKVSINNSSEYVRTPYIKINRGNDIIVNDLYEASLYAPLAFFDKDFNFISWADNAEGTKDNTLGIKSFTLPSNLIPSDAVYFIAQGRRDYEENKNVENGLKTLSSFVFGDVEKMFVDVEKNSLDIIQTNSKLLEKLVTGNLFFYNGVNRNGTENLTIPGTPFIKIDKNFDIQVRAYEAPSTYSPLNFYDKDLNFISAVISGSSGIKDITILKENIPSDAEYIRCSVNTININPYVKNGVMSYDRLILGLTRIVDSLVKSFSTLEANVNSSPESKFNIGNLFYIKESLVKEGGGTLPTAVSTPYITIDKESPIEVKGGYAMASSSSTKLSPLNFYNENFEYIGYADNDSLTPDDTTGVKTFTLSTSNIPEAAVYMRAGTNLSNLLGREPYIKNGKISFGRIIVKYATDIKNLQKSVKSIDDRVNVIEQANSELIEELPNVNQELSKKLVTGNLFFCFGGVYKDGTVKFLTDSEYVNTPFIRIDKDSDIVITRAYESPSLYAPLAFFDKDFNFITWTDNSEGGQTGTAGIKTFILPKSLIPTNAIYFAATGRRDFEAGKNVTNGDINAKRILVPLYINIKKNADKIAELENKVDTSKQDYSKDIKKMADRYDTVITKRESYLRQKYNYDGIGKWYGVTWREENDAHNVTDISSEGDEALCNELPIQNKMRRCVIKDGVLQYYLNSDNSELKEDGSQAKLDGTDGNVMVEIPEFFYKFEVTENDGVKTVKLMISENGIDGFNYSPKHYVGAYYATLNRETNILSTVCTTNFTRSEVELKTEEEGSFIEGDTYSLGVQKLAVRNGFTENAAIYRGGHQTTSQTVRDPNNIGTEVSEDYWDNANNPSQNTFCLNKLGVAIAQVKRSECRNQSRMWLGETMYLYDTQRALWILSSIEFKTRNIQDAINNESPREGGLGWGATVYPNYEAYEAYFSYRGTACIPNGVTNNLGNHSGEVYYRMYQVPVEFSGSLGSPSFDRFANVLIPVMSYRGIENFYGHLYSAADQISLSCSNLGGENRRVDYWYQRNPFKCKTDISGYEYLGQYEFEATIKTISGILMGFDGHILPVKTADGYSSGYCDCSEIGASDDGKIQGISFNGRLVSRTLVGRNFIVSFWKDDERANRASESTRICAFIL